MYIGCSIRVTCTYNFLPGTVTGLKSSKKLLSALKLSGLVNVTMVCYDGSR